MTKAYFGIIKRRKLILNSMESRAVVHHTYIQFTGINLLNSFEAIKRQYKYQDLSDKLVIIRDVNWEPVNR